MQLPSVFAGCVLDLVAYCHSQMASYHYVKKEPKISSISYCHKTSIRYIIFLRLWVPEDVCCRCIMGFSVLTLVPSQCWMSDHLFGAVYIFQLLMPNTPNIFHHFFVLTPYRNFFLPLKFCRYRIF